MLATIERSNWGFEFYQPLVDGDESACRDLMCRLRKQEGLSVLEICDAMTEAFHKVGNAWQCAELEVYREHIASQIGYRLLLNLRSMLPPVDKDAPLAIGCTPERDPYVLPTLMVELVLRELGWQAQSFGTNLPLEMLAPAMDDVQPQLCWVSASYVQSAARLRQQLKFVGEYGHSRGVEIICGGQAVGDDVK